jgi:hypothetical protein
LELIIAKEVLKIVSQNHNETYDTENDYMNYSLGETRSHDLHRDDKNITSQAEIVNL